MLPSPHRVTLEGDGRSFVVGPGDSVLRAGLRAGVALPYECSVGCCGSCRIEILEGVAASAWPEAPGLTDRDRRRGRVLACQCMPESDLVLRVHLETPREPPIPPVVRTATLVSVTDLTADIREFVFRTAAPADFRPGQYALLHLPDLPAPRAYSMSNLPNAAGLYAFQIRQVPGGEATSRLFAPLFSPGARIELDAPYGGAHLRTTVERDIVCIAGGSGVGPMLSIAAGARTHPELARRQVHFFYGGRTPADICGEAALSRLPGYGAALRYEAAVSDAGEAPDWGGARGFVHELAVERLGAGLRDCEIYMAGPPAMITAAVEAFCGLDVPPSQIHFDRFF